MVSSSLPSGEAPMIAQEEEVRQQMTNEIHASVPAVEPNDHLNRLLISEVETPWYKSFIANIKDLVRPEKLPPLEVTSKPVAVKDIWGASSNKGKAGTTSLIVHICGIALLLALGTSKAVQEAAKEAVTLVAPDLAAYVP